MKLFKARTFDSMTRRSSKARDTVLAPATETELAEYFAGRAQMNPGQTWLGNLAQALVEMDDATKRKLGDMMLAYEPSIESGSMREGAAGSLASVGDGSRQLRQWRDQTGKVVDEINERNRRYWGQRSLQP